MERFAKSTDPVQQALRDHKKNWGIASKEFMSKIKALRAALSGKGDSKYGLTPSNIKDPLPQDIGSFLSELSSNFQLLVGEAQKIQQEQASYSQNRTKSKKELGAAIAAIAPNLVKTASISKKKATLKVSEKEFETLIAISEEEQAAGLMYVPPPAPVMSFVYGEPKINIFWMKNTPAPLDIVFALNGSIIAIHEGEPLSTKMIGGYTPSDLVVEFPRGSCEKLGIQIGDPISIVN